MNDSYTKARHRQPEKKQHLAGGIEGDPAFSREEEEEE